MESLSELRTCTETLPEGGRAFYSVFVLLFQFMLPMLTLSLAYYQVTINITEQEVTNRTFECLVCSPFVCV